MNVYSAGVKLDAQALYKSYSGRKWFGFDKGLLWTYGWNEVGGKLSIIITRLHEFFD